MDRILPTYKLLFFVLFTVYMNSILSFAPHGICPQEGKRERESKTNSDYMQFDIEACLCPDVSVHPKLQHIIA